MRSGRWGADAGTRRWRLQLLAVGLVALAVRLGYLLAFKHPDFVGGDAYWYHHGANLLVDGKGFIDPYRYKNGVVAQTADHPPGTTLVLAAASLFGMRSFFWHQLEMCLLGSGTVVVVAMVARQLAGRIAGLIAGLAAAVYPNLWFNDPMVMSETLVQFTTAVAIYAAYRWWADPTCRRASWLGVAVAACALARAEALLFVPLLLAPLMLLDRRHDWRERLRQLAVAGIATGVVVAPWVGYNLTRFNEVVTISTGLDPTVAVSNCDTVYYGPLTGYWSRPCILAMPVPTTGDVPAQEAAYRREALKYIKTHKSRLPSVVAARIGRTFGIFHPVQQIKLDEIETREYLFGVVGLAMYYVLAVGTAAGLWAMRRRRIPLSPIVATVGTVAFATAITFGQTRYRASAEPILVIGFAVAAVELARKVRERGHPDLAASAGEPEVVEVVPALAGVLPASHRRFPCFDGLRAIAALTVIVVHTSFPTGFSTRQHFWGAYTARMEIGVSVFFLISGFLLYRPFAAAHIEGRPGPAVAPYLKRRLLRIVPAYWVALFFAAYVLHTVSPPIHSVRGVVIYFGFLQIYFSHYVLHGISAAWTLCVEMSFYLFLPLYAAVVSALTRKGRDRLRIELVGLAVLVVVSEAWKVGVFVHRSGQQTGAGTWLPAQLDLFAVGMLFAVASVWWSGHRREPEVLGRPWVPGASWAAALVCFWAVSTRLRLPRVPVYEASLGQALGRQWLYGAFAFFLLIPAVFGPQDRGLIRGALRSRPAVAIGTVSYGIYLWHETWMLKILAWLHRPLFQTSFVKLTLGVAALAVASAAVSYLVVEQPLQRLGRRGPPARPPGEPGPEAPESAAVGAATPG